MNKILFGFAALAALSLGFASTAMAAPHGNSGHAMHGNYHSPVYGNHGYGNYHQTYGTRFNNGYFYRGYNHNHWYTQRWDARYGCQCYYDSGLSCWYYWCQPANCYYPLSYRPYNTYNFGPGPMPGPFGPGPMPGPGPGPMPGPNPGPVAPAPLDVPVVPAPVN